MGPREINEKQSSQKLILQWAGMEKDCELPRHEDILAALSTLHGV